MKGISGKILRVNLSSGEIGAENLPHELWRNWLGGRGLATWLWGKENSSHLDPLSSQARIYFAVSPLVGTLTPGVSKTAAVFKSPLTGGIFVSLCGGDIGSAIKFAGWDVIVIEGRSDKPVALVIDDEKVSIRQVSELWGVKVSEAEKALREMLGEDSVAVVAGPAGERLVKFASLHSGRGREFGRGGIGAIFGSKNLKGLVVRGGGRVDIADKGGLETLTIEAYRRMQNNEKAQIRRRWGTPELVATINELGFWPTRNFSEGYFEEGHKIDASAIEKSVLAGHRSCFSCPIRCGKVIQYARPDGSCMELEGPEFESLSLLGPNLGLGDIEKIAEASRLCDELGVDTISMGGAIGFVLEAYKKGKLSAKLSEGLNLEFGDEETIFKLIRMTALREGALGEKMAMGSRAFARELGCEELSMDVKGLGIPAYDPRGIKGLGLNYATSASGASHMRGPTMPIEIGENTRLDDHNKVPMVISVQINMAIADSLCLCSTARAGINISQLAQFLEAVTGESWSAQQLEKIGKDILTLERRLNIREGFSETDDTLPPRMLSEPFTHGASKGSVVNLEPMKKEYYKLMGWDEKGIPPPEP